jgi:small subunit ribosomal protein S27e
LVGETDWSKLIPKPTSRFLLVSCDECNNKQIVFEHAKTVVRCKVCNSILAKPRGGKAQIIGKVLDVYE